VALPTVLGRRGSVDEPPVRRRDDDLEGGAGRHRVKVLVKDRPPLLRGLVPHAYVVAVGGARLPAPTGRRLGEHHGVGVAVDAGVSEVGVVPAAVRVGGGVNVGGLLAGLFARVFAFGALRRPRYGAFVGGLRIRGTTSNAGACGPLFVRRARLISFEQAHNVASQRQAADRPHARGQHEGEGREGGVYQHPHGQRTLRQP
jgi:hypothetical protein